MQRKKMRSLTSCNIVSSLTLLVVLSPSTYGFSSSKLAKFSCLSSYATSTATSLGYSNWDAFETQDAFELMVGGTRYEMVELPDSSKFMVEYIIYCSFTVGSA